MLNAQKMIKYQMEYWYQKYGIFSYTSINPMKKIKKLDVECVLYGEKENHHMICKLKNKFSELNFKKTI